MNELFKYFPREVAVPYRINCQNKSEFFKTIDRYNARKKRIYFSVFNSTDYIKIDKLPFDLDNKYGLKNMITMHKWLQSKDLKHLMIFSTGGFWMYVFTKKYDKLINLKDALTNAQEYIAKECKLTIYMREITCLNDKCKHSWHMIVKDKIKCPKCNKHLIHIDKIDAHYNDIDFHIIGDIKRIGRMPNTFDKKRGIFCIPITASDLYKGFEHIKKKAKKQCFDYIYYGTKYLDISKHDTKREYKKIDMPEGNYNINLSKADKIVKLFPPCVQSWLLESGKDTFEARFYFAVFCASVFRLPKNACDELAKKYFTFQRADKISTNYDHFRKVKALDYAYSESKEILFPDCETLFRKGLCSGKCNQYNKIYK